MAIPRNIPTITIDLDKNCVECGKGGAANSGICLKCTTRAIQGKPMKSREGKAIATRFRNSRKT